MRVIRHLRWLALVPLAVGLWFLLWGALWIELDLLLAAAALLALSAAVWRASAGEWPFRGRSATADAQT